MRELDTESPVVWPAWCYTGESVEERDKYDRLILTVASFRIHCPSYIRRVHLPEFLFPFVPAMEFGGPMENLERLPRCYTNVFFRSWLKNSFR